MDRVLKTLVQILAVLPFISHIVRSILGLTLYTCIQNKTNTSFLQTKYNCSSVSIMVINWTGRLVL